MFTILCKTLSNHQHTWMYSCTHNIHTQVSMRDYTIIDETYVERYVAMEKGLMGSYICFAACSYIMETAHTASAVDLWEDCGLQCNNIGHIPGWVAMVISRWSSIGETHVGTYFTLEHGKLSTPGTEQRERKERERERIRQVVIMRHHMNHTWRYSTYYPQINIIDIPLKLIQA